MLFHRHFPPCQQEKKTFLGEKLAEISFCVTSPASRRGRELVSLPHCTFKRKNKPNAFLPLSLSNLILPGFLSQGIYMLPFIITLFTSHRYVWMNRTKLQDSSQPLSLANHPPYLHLPCFYSHTHTHYLCLCLLFCYLSLFTVSVFLSQDAAGISFLSYWSQSAPRREDIRMEGEQEEG